MHVETMLPGQPQLPKQVGHGRYSLIDSLSSGRFAAVWRGVDVQLNFPVAIKIEIQNEDHASLLEDEAALLSRIAAKQPEGFAEYFSSGETCDGEYHYLVMELLGPSLEDHLSRSAFTPQSVLLVAEQGLRRLEWLHAQGVVYRDIKPENFLFGARADIPHHLYLVDFGLCKVYHKEAHVQPAQDVFPVGTARYSSVASMQGHEQSRRDDLESFGYLLVYLLTGSLPWSGFGKRGMAPDELRRIILKAKLSLSLQDLCAKVPDTFREYLEIVRSLEFEERPDYQLLHQLFARLRAKIGPREDHGFQWLQGCRLGPLKPLVDWESPTQPDEGSMSSWWSCHPSPTRRERLAVDRDAEEGSDESTNDDSNWIC